MITPLTGTFPARGAPAAPPRPQAQALAAAALAVPPTAAAAVAGAGPGATAGAGAGAGANAGANAGTGGPRATGWSPSPAMSGVLALGGSETGQEAPPAAPRHLDAAEMRDLLLLAEAHPELRWPAGRDIALARNAHYTNTLEELTRALAGRYDWFEGDVRVGPGGQLVMQHRSGDRGGLTLEQWLRVGARSGRGLKLDIKDAAAIDRVLAAVRRHGIEDERLILNVTVMAADAGSVAHLRHLRAIRQAFPRAMVNLSVTADRYTPQLISQLAQVARLVGQPAMFPLRVDLVSPAIIAALRPLGRIAIWNTPELYSPRDVASDIARLRLMGVDGMIDLRQASGTQNVVRMLVAASMRLLGWRLTMRLLARYS